MTYVKHEQCSRCGHRTPDCPNCDRSWPFLGAGVGGHRLCHSFVEDGPTCLEQEMWSGALQGAPWIHWPRDKTRGEVA